MVRAMASTGPPGAKATMIRKGLLFAWAIAYGAENADKRAMSSVRFFMVDLLG